MSAALEGIRVLDLTAVLMGPLATQILGDLGADVISVEAAAGDTNRFMGPGPHPQLSGVSLNLLRNKRNICLDLKAPGVREVVLRLAATCDVVITNLRPGPLERLGLTYDDVRKVRPDIVFCQAHGWPSDSSDANRPAYDDIIQTATGISDAFALVDGEPKMAPILVADKVCGLTITYAVLAALFHRQRTGEGQFIEVPMVQAMSAFVLAEHGCGAIPEPKLGAPGYKRIIAKNRRPHKTADGYISVLPYTANDYQSIFEVGGRLDLAGDDRLSSKTKRVINSSWLYGEVAAILSTRTTEFWVAFCEQHSIPASRIVTLAEMVDELPIREHAIAGRFREIPVGARLGATPMTVRTDAPIIGQQTVEVLHEAGLGDAEIAQLLAAGSAFQAGPK